MAGLMDESFDYDPPGPPAVKVYEVAWVNWQSHDWSGNDPYAVYKDRRGLFIMFKPSYKEPAKKLYLTPKGKRPKGKRWAKMWQEKDCKGVASPIKA